MTAWKHIITGLAVGCLLGVNALALPQVVRHSLHHEHHSATTHSSAICFWVCSAGQMEESASLLPPQEAQPLGEIATPLAYAYSSITLPATLPRGPPALPSPVFF